MSCYLFHCRSRAGAKLRFAPRLLAFRQLTQNLDPRLRGDDGTYVNYKRSSTSRIRCATSPSLSFLFIAMLRSFW